MSPQLLWKEGTWAALTPRFPAEEPGGEGEVDGGDEEVGEVDWGF